jgi:hypothetical protein
VARKSKNDPLAVDAYLGTLPKAERDALGQLRTLIRRPFRGWRSGSHMGRQ